MTMATLRGKYMDNIVCYGCGFPMEIEYDIHRDVLRAKMCKDCLKVLTDTAYQLGINAARTSEDEVAR